MLSNFARPILLTLIVLLFSITTFAQTAAFNYQGKLSDGSLPASGTYQMQFALFDDPTGTTQIGSTVTKNSVTVSSGIFSVQLDFGVNAFPGDARYLEIAVKKVSEPSYTTLTPRQPIDSVPYAVRALSAAAADTSTNATNATTAADFTGNLSGDVSGTQNATIVSTVGGISSANIATSVGTVNTATSDNTADTLVKRDASGNFNAGTITANLNGNAATSTSSSSVAATSGDSVVNAINNAATTGKVSSSRLSSDVVLLNPAATQTPTATTQGNDALLNLTGNYTACSNTYQSNFRLHADGGLLSVGNYDGGCSGLVPVEGAGTRMFWYPGKAAFRAGGITGTQWDDANIGLYSTAFGENVRALGDYSIALGKNAVAANVGTIGMGEGITATGANSVALGYGASTSTIAGSPRTGSFVFSDRSVPLTYSFNSTTPDIGSQFHPTVTNSFNVRAVNGSFFYTNTALTTGFTFNSTTANLTLTNSKFSMFSDGSSTLYSNSGFTSGVTLPAGGGSWSSVSDRNMKENFGGVNTRDILQRVLKLPISTWNYKTQNSSVRHIGPMAQDFYKLFGVGESDTRIATIDPDGVALAAIQGLNEELKDRDKKIEDQQQELNSLQEQVKQQQRQIEIQQLSLEALKKLVCADKPGAEICKQ